MNNIYDTGNSSFKSKTFKEQLGMSKTSIF